MNPEAGDGPSSRAEIQRVMQDVQRQYGTDAVALEGHLLSHAVRNGSMGEVVVSVSGFEDRDGTRFLAFKLETGIIYNDREINADTRLVRAWSDIVEASLRKFQTLTLPADGVALRLAYAHRAYLDEAEARSHLRDQPGDAETASFFLRLADVRELLAGRLDSQQLLDRSTSLCNGTAARVVLPAPTRAAEAAQ